MMSYARWKSYASEMATVLQVALPGAVIAGSLVALTSAAIAASGHPGHAAGKPPAHKAVAHKPPAHLSAVRIKLSATRMEWRKGKK